MSNVNFGPALPSAMKGSDGAKVQSGESDTAGDGGTDSYDIGPVLPPGFLRQTNTEAEDDDAGASSVESDSYIGPPALPTQSPAASSSASAYGPALPPGYEEEKRSDVIGPALPDHLRETLQSPSSEEEDMIGPAPFTGDYSSYSAASDFERRANKMKDRLTKKEPEKEMKRESWMTELPENAKAFGLGPRTFRKSAAPQDKDRSVWTDTPADRAKKAQQEAEKYKGNQAKSRKGDKEGAPVVSKRDLKISDEIEKFNQEKRPESLVEMHTASRKRRQATEEEKGVTERRPFSREHDLQVNRLDDAKRKQLMKKSAELGTKFAHSKDSIFM